MKRKPDQAHIQTDKELAALEKRIAAEYRKAAEELQEKIDDYFEQFKKRDAEQLQLLQDGKITRRQYTQWRLAQIGRGKRFEALRDRVAERMTKANEVAAAYINDKTPGIYSLNRNYAAYTIEQQVGANVGFDLWDEQTVKRLIVEQPDLMPYYPPKRAVKRGIDLKWGKQQITAQVTSGILQGESIKHLADRLQTNIPHMNRDSAIRAARTAITGAQNAGRLDSYLQAESMGIQLKKRWLSTLDGRTRHAHQLLDGQVQPNEKPFHSILGDIMFPGDPNAAPANVYNCRCTLIAELEGVDMSYAKRRARDPETEESVVIEDMTYAEWARWKKQTNQVASPAGFGIIEVVEQIKPKVTYRTFETGEKANEFFYYDGEEQGLLARKRSKHAQWEKSLTQEEDEAIRDYTGGGYSDLNKYLRRVGDWQDIDAEKEEFLVKGLDSAISRYELKDNIRVQRGVMNDVIDRLAEENDIQESLSELVGKKYREAGYSSTTVLRDNGVATAKPTILDIEIPPGIGRGAYVNQLAGQYQDTEYEFLIRRGATFTIKEVREEEIMGEYHYYIKMVMDVEQIR